MTKKLFFLTLYKNNGACWQTCKQLNITNYTCYTCCKTFGCYRPEGECTCEYAKSYAKSQIETYSEEDIVEALL